MICAPYVADNNDLEILNRLLNAVPLYNEVKEDLVYKGISLLEFRFPFMPVTYIQISAKKLLPTFNWDKFISWDMYILELRFPFMPVTYTNENWKRKEGDEIENETHDRGTCTTRS